MNKSSILFHSIFVFFGIFLYGKSFSEPANLSIVKTQIKTYHDQGEYNKELETIAIQAKKYIQDEIKSNHHKHLAMVFDIDETLLSNYSNLIERDFINDYQRIHKDTLKGDAAPILPLRTLYNYVKNEHVDIFLISGRFESERIITIHNLKKAGFHEWKGLYLQPNSNYGKTGTIEGFKIATRKQLTKQGYTIIASIGDQPIDLSCGYALKTFKLPNPFYYSPAKCNLDNKKAA
jgi:hypothetical protein